MNLFGISIIAFWFLVQIVLAFKDTSDFTEWEPLTFIDLDVSISNSILKRNLLVKSSDYETYITFGYIKEYVNITLCIYESEYKYQKEETEFANCFQKEEIVGPKKINIKRTPTDSYFLVLKNYNTSEEEISLLFFNRWETETLKKDEKSITINKDTDSNKAYFYFTAGPSENLTLAISKTFSDNNLIVRIFDIEEGTRIIKTTNISFYSNINNEGSTSKNYLVEISTEQDIFQEKHKGSLSSGKFIPIQEGTYFTFDFEGNKTFYFKYYFDVDYTPFVGLEFKNNEAGYNGTVKCYLGCTNIALSDEDLIRYINTGSDNCLSYFAGDKSIYKHYVISENRFCRYNQFLLISHEVTYPNKNGTYIINVPQLKKETFLDDKSHFKYSITPFTDSIINFNIKDREHKYENALFYLANSDLFISSHGFSLVKNFSPVKGGAAVYSSSSVSYVTIILFNKEDKVKVFDIYLQYIKENIQNLKVQNGEYAITFNGMGNNHFNDYYIISANNYKEAKFYFSQFYGSNCSVYYKKIVLTKEGDLDYLPTSEDQIKPDVIVPFEVGIMKTYCEAPTDLVFYLFGSEVESLKNGATNVFLKGGIENKLTSIFETLPGHSAISVGNSKENVVVRIGNDTFEISPNNYEVFSFNNCKECDLFVRSHEDSVVKFISIPPSEYFYDLNKEINWNVSENQEVKKELGNRVMYTLNGEGPWEHIKISISSPSSKYSKPQLEYVLGYFDTYSKNDENITVAFPLYQVVIRDQWYINIEIKNPILFDSFANINKTFYLQVISSFNINELYFQKKTDTDFYGYSIAEKETETLLLENSFTRNVLHDSFTKGQSNTILALLSFCGKEEEKVAIINSIYNNKTSKTQKGQTGKIVFELSTDSLLQIRLRSGDFEPKSTHSEGVAFGYITNPFENETKFVEKYLNYSGGQVNFDPTTKKVYWDTIDESSFEYGAYLVPISLYYRSQEVDLENFCFLEDVRINGEEMFNSYLELGNKSSFILENNITGEIGINIVATPKIFNVPLKILYKPIFLTTFKEIIFTEPELKKNFIEFQYNLVYIKLKNDNWEYFRIRIPREKISFTVYFGIEKGEISLPEKDPLNLFDNAFGGAFYFKNPCTGDESCYIYMRFTNNILSEYAKAYSNDDSQFFRAQISYDYTKTKSDTKNVEMDELGIITFRNISDFKDPEIYNGTTFKFFQNITINKQNKFTIVAKKCRRGDEVFMTLSSIENEEDYDEDEDTDSRTRIDENEPIDVSTYSEMFFTGVIYDGFLEENESGYEISWGKDLTKEMKKDLKDILNLAEKGKINYDEKKRTFNFVNIQFKEHVYEKQIYVMPKVDEIKSKMKSDCYLKYLKENSPKGFIYKAGKGDSVEFDEETGDYIASMVIVYKYPIPLRIVSNQIEFHVNRFDTYKDYPKRGIKEISLLSKYLLIIFPEKENWKYLEVSLTDTELVYHAALGFAESEDKIKLIEETEETKFNQKEKVFVFSNPYNKTADKGVFYFQIRFSSEPLDPSLSPIKSTYLSFQYFSHFAESITYDNYSVSYTVKSEKSDFYVSSLKDIKVNEKNTISIISKNCYEKDTGKVLAFTGGKNPIYNSTLGGLKFDSFETYSDVFVQQKNAQAASYNGFWFGAKLNLSEEEKKKAEEIIKAEPGKISFDSKTFTYSWEPVDGVNEYEVYIFKKSAETVENEGNDCFLIENKGSPGEDLVLFKVTNQTSVVFKESGDFIVKVVALALSPIPCRLNKKTLYNYVTSDYTPSEKHEEIALEHKNISFIIPHTTQWNYAEIKISDIQFPYYYILYGESFEYKEDNVFTFYNKDSEISTEKKSKYSFRFSDTSLKDSPSKNGDTEYTTYYVPDTPAKNHKNFYFNSLKSSSLPSLLSDSLNELNSNNITLAVKACTKPLQLKVIKGHEEYLSEKIDENYKLFNIQAFSLIALEIKQLEEISKYNGFSLSYNVSVSDSDRKEAEKYLTSGKDLKAPTYTSKDTKITWDLIEGLDYYLVYFLKERDLGCAKSDCCLMEKVASEKAQVWEVKSGSSFTLSSIDGAGIAVVVGVSKGKLPLRILYPPVEILTPHQIKIDARDKKQKVEGQSYTSVLYNYQSGDEKYDYLEISISGITRPYKVIFKLYDKSKPYELPSKKSKAKDYTFVFANPYKDQSDPTEKYYFSLLFDETQNSLTEKKYSSLKAGNEEQSYSFNIEVHYGKKSQTKESDMKKREDNSGYYIFKDSSSAYFEVSEKIKQNEENEIFLIAKKCAADNNNLGMKIISGSQESVVLETQLKNSYELYEFNTFTDFSGIVSSDNSNSGVLLNYATDLGETQQSKLRQMIAVKEQKTPKLNGSKLTWEKIEGFPEAKFEVYILKKSENTQKNGGDECFLLKSNEIIEVLKSSDNSAKVEVKEKNFIVTVVGVIEEPIPMRIVYPPLETNKSSSSKLVIYILVILGVIVLVAIIVIFVLIRLKKKEINSDIERSSELENKSQINLVDQ